VSAADAGQRVRAQVRILDMKSAARLISMTMLSGCVTVSPVSSNGTYRLTASDRWISGDAGELRAWKAAIARAQEFCAGQGKRAMAPQISGNSPMSIESSPNVMTKGSTEAIVVFKLRIEFMIPQQNQRLGTVGSSARIDP
jgi:hypothetical protein